ncbi:13932_t:CDS:2, partial [Ambispora leptoticha]
FSRSSVAGPKGDPRIMWTNEHLRLLIDERKTRNVEYYDIMGISREDFWNSVANKINRQFNTTYTGYQCKGKFQSLVKDYNSICQHMAGSSSEMHFDQIRNVNTSSRRREERRRNRTPPPTYEEVSSMLNMSRRESPAGQRDRSASPTRRIPSRRDETTNRDNASNLGGHLGNNTNNVGGNSRNNTNDAGGNSSHNTNSVDENSNNNMTHNDTHGLLSNISASQNDSDISMADVEGSQPLEPINEEGS